MRVVVVGGGMAGTRLAAELAVREAAGRLAVTVLGAEPVPGYNRVLLCDILAGRLSTSDLPLPAPAGAAVRTGTEVVAIDRTRRLVHLAGGESVPYDVLVLATGSAPVMPPLPGLRHDRGAVYPLRTVEDYVRLLAALPAATRVAVVGGGPLGVETATALAGRGLAVTIVHKHGRILPGALDAEGAAAIRRLLRSRGVTTNVAAAAIRWCTNRRGAVTGVEMDGGRTVDADLVVVACGARPRVTLARDAGLPVSDRGIAVDDALRTADPSVYAVGDCAAHPGAVGGHVAPAWAQVDVLADRLTGRDPSARYRGTPRLVRLRGGLDVAAAGEPEARDGDRVVQLADATRAVYHKLIVRDGRLAGMVAVGHHDAVPMFLDWHVRATPVPALPVPFFTGERQG